MANEELRKSNMPSDEQVYVDKIYYEPQKDWTEENYYYLHRVLHRILFYYKKHTDEISHMDLNRMTEETKVLIYCIVRYYHYEFLFDTIPGGEALVDLKPLEHTLVLDQHPLSEDNVYKVMNVMY